MHLRIRSSLDHSGLLRIRSTLDHGSGGSIALSVRLSLSRPHADSDRELKITGKWTSDGFGVHSHRFSNSGPCRPEEGHHTDIGPDLQDRWVSLHFRRSVNTLCERKFNGAF
ncbi:hypothetical protein AAFF_G00396930 [Aldrovandia affinis]|uniref:Uncharacterized protein n=1 Tax=Aldrovandia affinis TaxID=143900 RepID=A0AAD7SCY3_9TELE|nr:hypothetical protein AAFF_G00396930 [Aldrovandia affinis]